MTEQDFEVLTPVGQVLLTTPNVQIARAFVKERVKKVPGLSLRIESVVTTVERVRVPLRERPSLQVVQASNEALAVKSGRR